MNEQLSPAGASFLRAAREAIIRDPNSFDMSEWSCGSVACIGGHMMLEMNLNPDSFADEAQMSSICGFQEDIVCEGHPLWNLFYEWPEVCEKDVEVAARRIDAFLWEHGYVPNEMKEPMKVMK